MTQEEKDLLLKDLCARLPYGVKMCTPNKRVCKIYSKPTIDSTIVINGLGEEVCSIKDIKPYLFPLSSMNDEQKVIYGDLCQAIIYSLAWDMQAALNELFDWLNENHFDYQGLIPMGLANDATGLNIY